MPPPILLPPDDRSDRLLTAFGKVLPILMHWAVAALVAYVALNDRMSKMEAGAGLSVHRSGVIEEQVRELTRDSKATLENSTTTRTMVENIREQMRGR